MMGLDSTRARSRLKEMNDHDQQKDLTSKPVFFCILPNFLEISTCCASQIDRVFDDGKVSHISLQQPLSLPVLPRCRTAFPAL